MYQELLEYVKILVSLFFMGLSIKTLDDYIDESKKSYIPYILCFLCISVCLWKNSAALFLSSYIVGMFHDVKLTLITGLKAYQEQIAFFIISVMLIGFIESIYALIIICIIQLIDDLIDEKSDRYECKKNWVFIIGKVEVIIITSIFLILSFYLKPYMTVTCILLSLIISSIFNYIKNQRFMKEML